MIRVDANLNAAGGPHGVGDTCRVLVPDADEESATDRHFESLRIQSERYVIGLPSEYMETIFERGAALGAAGALPSGTAQVRWAAHGDASSSVPMFRYLTSVLLRVAAAHHPDLTSPLLVAMFDEPIR